MTDAPRTAADFGEDDIRALRATGLELAFRLGDHFDELVIVGGVVPTLLAPGGEPEAPLLLGPHVGSKDIDLGLSLAILDGRRYEAIAERLAQAGFQPDTSEDGTQVKSRWRHRESELACPVDILIQADPPTSRLGKSKHLTGALAAMRMPYIGLALANSLEIEMVGETLAGDHASRRLRVCGPAAFVALKAHAFRNRGYEKDAYDLYHMIRNYVEPGGRGEPPADAAAHWRHVRGKPGAKGARRILTEDFASPNHVGPGAVARFLGREDDDALRADAFAFVQDFMRLSKRV